MADVKLSVPSNELPYIVFAEANFVVVLALPDKLPVTLPVKSPVKLVEVKELNPVIVV